MNFLNLKAALSLNGSGFAIGLKRAESKTKQFAKEIKSEFARAFGTAAITAYAVKVVNLADDIVDFSERLGISTKALQEWAYAAKKSGENIEMVTKFLENLGIAREKALGGDENMISGFGRFGIGQDELQNLNIDQLGRRVSNAVRGGNIEDLRKSLRDLGGEVSKLIPMMRTGIDELSQEAHDFSRIFSEETLENLTTLKNEVLLLADAFTGPLAKAIASALIPLRELLAGVTAPIAATSAYLGARFGGATPGEALDAAAAASTHERTAGQRMRERMEASIAARQAMAGQLPSGDPGLTTKAAQAKALVEKVASRSASGEPDKPELNAWQQLGAAVRFVPDDRKNDSISKEQLRELQAIRKASEKLSAGNFGAEASGGF